MKVRPTSLFILILLASQSLLAQVNFTASVSKNKVAVGDRLTVEFSVNQRGRNFKAPDFSGFRILSGPNTSMSTFMDNRGVRTSFSHSYILQPRNTGEITIGPAFITVEGETYQTKPLTISVSESAPASGKPNDAEDQVFIRALVSKKEVYQGEPIFARYKLYFRTEIGQPQLIEEPDFTGFYRENIEQGRIETRSEIIQGQRYTTGNIREMTLIPQRNGALSPGGLRLEVPTQVRTGRYDFFGRPINRTVPMVVSDNFPTIEVKPLPLAGQPASFTGGVGDFSFTASLSQDEITTDESLSLRIEIKGTGNIKLVGLPEIDFPQAFEVFDPEMSESFSVGAYGMRGRKTVEYLLVPRYNGTYKIGPIEFSFFNPETRRYEKRQSPEFQVVVSGGQIAPGGRAPEVAGSEEKEQVGYLNQDILFIKLKADSWQVVGSEFWFSWPFYLWLVAIVLASAVLFLLRRRQAQRRGNRQWREQQQAGKTARKRLTKARKALKNADADVFYQELSQALWDYLAHKFSLARHELQKDRIVKEMAKAGIDDQWQARVLQALDQAEMARFTQAGGANLAEDYRLTAELITAMEKGK